MFDFITKLFCKANDDDYEVRFRVFDEDGNVVLDTESVDEFRAFLEHEEEEMKKARLCSEDCAGCDACDTDEDDYDIVCDCYDGTCGGNCDECPYDDDEDYDIDDEEDVIFEIPVAGVLAAAALIGSVAALIKALKKR